MAYDPRALVPYIRETAAKYGIDPDVAIKVAESEGLNQFTSGIPGENSYGAFQLNTQGGLGNDFQKATGLDPSDPKNEQAAIDYALKYASKNGWGAFHGAKNRYGYGPWEGIGGNGTAALPPNQAPPPTIEPQKPLPPQPPNLAQAMGQTQAPSLPAFSFTPKMQVGQEQTPDYGMQNTFSRQQPLLPQRRPVDMSQLQAMLQILPALAARYRG